MGILNGQRKLSIRVKHIRYEASAYNPKPYCS